MEGPLGIIAVAGMYRTGKSYLLNRMLLDRSDGFGVGPTINPCTKGVWMWGKPVDGLTPDGDQSKSLFWILKDLVHLMKILIMMWEFSV